MKEHICHADIPEGTTGRGCGHPIPAGEEYRCFDCGAVMHRDCLRWHCSADEKDRRIWDLQGEVASLKALLGWDDAGGNDKTPDGMTRGGRE